MPRNDVTTRVLGVLPPRKRRTWLTALEIAVLADLKKNRSLHPALNQLALRGTIARRKNAYGRWEYAR